MSLLLFRIGQVFHTLHLLCLNWLTIILIIIITKNAKFITTKTLFALNVTGWNNIHKLKSNYFHSSL